MGVRDLAEQLRILAEAKGDPARLALATVDLAYGSLDESQRSDLRTALESSAVPHWIDEALLGAMLGGTPEDCARQLARLRGLRVIEPFPARGNGAVNVHQASRIALRAKLRSEAADRFTDLSARLRESLARRPEPACRIEALYHLFAVDQEAAATEWERIDREIVHPVEKETMAAAFDELMAEGWLAPVGRTVALLARGFVSLNRGEYGRIEAMAREAIELARQTGRERLQAIAQCLLGDVLVKRGETREPAALFQSQLEILDRYRQREPDSLVLRREVAIAHSKIADVREADGLFADALTAMRSAASILTALLEEHPGDLDLQRELATAHVRVGSFLQALEDYPAALGTFQLALAAYEALTRRDPSNSDWQLDLAAAHSNLGVLFRDQGQLDDSSTHLRANLDILQRLSADDPPNGRTLHELAVALWHVSITTERLGRLDEAIDWMRQAERQVVRAMALTPAMTKWQDDHQNIQAWLQDHPGPG